MRSAIFLFLMIFCIPGQGFTKDYLVELFEEHYQEKMIVGGGEMKTYHTWQVATEYGDKLLVIVGEDHIYRDWLRQSAMNHKIFLIKIPDGGDDRFKYDMAVLVNVQQVHSVWEKKWKCKECRHGAPPFRPPPENITLTVAQEP
ncbi:MAG: hypothetical protein ABIK15_21090 [Pseudomonadota bacterium]